jgi:tetratricopeptide (TPR) repeat protein
VSGSRGDYARTESYIKEGLAIARELGDRERICTMLINLGVTSADQGNDSEAEEYFQEGLELARQIGHKEWISLILINLGDVICDQGDYSQAEIYFKEGLALSREIEHREWISLLLLNLGLTTRKQGQYAQAESYFYEGLSLSRQIGIPQMIANALYEYGNLCLDKRRIEKAKVTFDEMFAIVPEGNQDLRALAQYGLARTAVAQKDIQTAQRLGGISVMALEAMGHRNAKEVKDWLKSVSI